MIIQDGHGTAAKAKVSKSGRVSTAALTLPAEQLASRQGNGFNVNTGQITLTSANKSALVYIKNTNVVALNLIIPAFIYMFGPSTGGTGMVLVQVERGPTAGTLVSGGTSFDAVNRHFGSTKSLTATVLKGSEGSTLTGGTVIFESLVSPSSRNVVTVGAVILPPNSTVGITVTPQASNTSMLVMLALEIYLGTFDEELNV